MKAFPAVSGKAVRAFALLPDEIRHRSRLTLVGDGPLRGAIRKLSTSLQLTDRVTLLGQRSDVAQLMQQATLLVLPSLWEGLPNVVLEAMACGLPLIATDVDGTRELVRHQQTGWLVQPQQPQQLATAIANALCEPEVRQQIAANARELVAQQYSWSSVINSYDALLRSLVSATPSGHTL